MRRPSIKTATLLAAAIAVPATVIAVMFTVYPFGFLEISLEPREPEEQAELPRKEVWHEKPNYTPKWTPDGSRIIFFWKPDEKIYSVSTNGTDLKLLFDEPQPFYHNWNPAISPDGSRIAYATMRHPHTESQRNFEIETSTLDGEDRQRLTNHYGPDQHPAWSPDGQWILFERTLDGKGPSGLYIVRPDRSEERLVVPIGVEVGISSFGIVHGPTSDPSGELIGFTIREAVRVIEKPRKPVLVTNWVIYTVRPDGSDLTAVHRADGLQSGRIQGTTAWSPDGQWLAFIKMEPPELEPQKREAALYIIRPDGENLRRLASPQKLGVIIPRDIKENDSLPTVQWSPEGKTIYIGKPSHNSVLVDVETGETRQGPPTTDFAAFSPDGETLAATSYIWPLRGAADQGKLFTVDLKTGEERTLVTNNQIKELNARLNETRDDD